MSHNPDDVTAKDVSVSKPRTRVAMVVFADVEGDDPDSWHIARRAITDRLGPMNGEVHTVRIGRSPYGRPVGVRFHDVMEAGMAAGNGYLWTEVTAKAYRQYEWQYDEEDADNG